MSPGPASSAPGGAAARRATAALALALAPWAWPAPARGADGDDPPAPAPGSPAPGASRPAIVEELVVTATRSPRPARDVPAAATVLPRAEIERSPSKTVDELLRSVPSFGLFRRNSSLVSDPTAQGVNLRGIGPSGVSRSLVLVDGIPANDFFGGWVYWRSLPRLGIERIEVVPGGGSALYGNYALGGVTQVFSRSPAPLAAEATAEAGSFGSSLLGARASERWGPVGAALDAEILDSRGYPVVADYARGPVDGRAPSTHAAVSARLEAAPAPGQSAWLRGGWFYEDQNGGTRFTSAEVRRLELAGGARSAAGEAGALELSVYGHRNRLGQERARISSSSAASPRDGEDLAGIQGVPVHDLGAGLLFTSRPLELVGKHVLSAGIDARRVTGAAHEALFPLAPVPDTAVVRRDSRGEQRLYGAFAQDLYDPAEEVALSLAVRYDRWDNLHASKRELQSGGSSASTPFPARSDGQPSPKLGLRLRPLEWLTVRAGAYRAFRAPTLNELYRPFQVGQVTTLANPNLGPETLRGAEAGLEVRAPGGLAVRASGFWNALDDPIVNVTLDPLVNPNLRQRQNLGWARIRGIEAEAGWRPSRAWLATVGYTLAESRVMEASDSRLVGKRLPQDPVHRATFSLSFDDPRIVTAAAQVRYLGRQYEDDQNAQPMVGAWVVDLSASRRLTSSVDLILAVENLFDREYLVGRAGVDTVGQPRFVHGGVRVRLGGEGDRDDRAIRSR